MMTSSIEVQDVVQITPPAESLLITHTKDHEAYQCPEELCPFTTSSPSLLGLHKSQVHKIKTKAKTGVVYHYFCPFAGCNFNPQSGRFFKLLDHLKTHYMKVHFEKKFKCSKCLRAFGLERDCLRHEKVCGLTFTCADCGKEYNNKPALSMHCLSKGHKLPPSAQKVPKAAKCDSKYPKKKLPPKEKKRKASTVPILPKLPLPNNMSILIPTDRNDVTSQSLCDTMATLGQNPLKVNHKNVSSGADTEIFRSSKASSGELSCGSTPYQDVAGMNNGLTLLSFNQSACRPSLHPLIAAKLLNERLHSKSSSQTPTSSSNFSNELKEQDCYDGKVLSSSGNRELRNQTSSQMASSISVFNLNDLSQQSKIINAALNNQPCEKAFLVDNPLKDTNQKIFISSTSPALSSASKSTHTGINLKVLSCKPVGQTTDLPHSTESLVYIQGSSSNAAVSQNPGKSRDMLTNKGQTLELPSAIEFPKQVTSIQLPSGNISGQSEKVQKVTSDISNLTFSRFDTESNLALTTAQTQTPVPYPSNYLASDTETQTLESFMLDSLTSLLTDCETQTFESSAPFNGLISHSETQTMKGADVVDQLFSDCDKQTFPKAAELCDILNDSSTQTFPRKTSDSDTQTFGTITLDSTVQTSRDDLSFETSIYSSENLLSLPSEDISCQVDPEDLFMNDAVAMLDMMTQTFEDINTNVQISESSAEPQQNLLNRRAGWQWPKSQITIMTQTSDLLDTTQPLPHDVPVPSGPLDKVRAPEKLGSSGHTFEGFDMQTSLFESFDSWTNSIHILNSPGEAAKFLGARKQMLAGLKNVDAVTQTLFRNNDTAALTLNCVDTTTQTLDRSCAITQRGSMDTEKQASFNMTPTGTCDATVQAIETFDSLTQTATDYQAFSQLTDGLFTTADREVCIENAKQNSVTQNLDSLDILAQSANNCYNMTQATNSFDTMTQTANNSFDTMTQTANNSFDTMTQTANNSFNTMTQTTNNSFNTTMTQTNNNSFDTMTQTANNFFDTMTQTSNHSFNTMTQTTNNSFNTMTQTANNSFDTMTQTANSFDTMTQTADSFDTMTQTANNFDIMTQTASNFDTMTQTIDIFNTMTQTTNNFDTMTQTTNNFDTMTQTDMNNFDTMTKMTDSFDTMTQTANNCDTMTQTADYFGTMTQTANNFDTMTQTANNFDTMTQTADSFGTITQTANNNFDTMTQTINNFDTMTQTINNFDTMTQTVNNFDTMTQTVNNFDTVPQIASNFDTMTQTANVFDNMTQTGDGLDTMTQTSNDFDATTETASREETTPQKANKFNSLSAGLDTVTQTSDDNVWIRMTSDERVDGCTIMTQTQTECTDLFNVNSHTHQAQGYDMMTQTAEKDLWEMVTQTERDMMSDMMTQTGSNDLWEVTTQTDHVSQASFDLTCDIFTQTGDNGLWEMTTQTGQAMESHTTMTQTLDNGLWEMTTQTDQVMDSDTMTQTLDNDLWEMTTQTDQVMESDTMTQTLGNQLWEMTTQTEDNFLSDTMTQTREIDFWELSAQGGLNFGSDIFTQTDSSGLWEMSTQTDS